VIGQVRRTLWTVPTENSESSEKSRVLRITALMSPACLSSSSDPSSRLDYRVIPMGPSSSAPGLRRLRGHGLGSGAAVPTHRTLEKLVCSPLSAIAQ